MLDFSQLLVMFWSFRRRVGNFPDGPFSTVIFTTFAEHIKGILDGKSFDFSLFLNSKCKRRFVTPDKIFGMWANNLVQDGCAPIFELVQNIVRRFVLDQLDAFFAQAFFELLNFTVRSICGQKNFVDPVFLTFPLKLVYSTSEVGNLVFASVDVISATHVSTQIGASLGISSDSLKGIWCYPTKSHSFPAAITDCLPTVYAYNTIR